MAWASTVAVVVPSPATSDVLLATSRTICAPMFSSGSGRSISFATVTPSLVIVGDPNDLLRMTLRPLGPRVTLTASARPLTPRRIAWRDASPYVISFAMSASLPGDGLGIGFPSSGVGGHSALDGRKDLVFSHDQVLHAVQLDLLAGVLAEEDGIARFHVELHPISVVADLAVARGDHRTALRFFLRGIRDDDAADLLFAFLEAFDENPVV